jgi:carbonic anhydrase/acetyltransferase-like protein (isoleucine patch superfamily)
MSRGAFLALLGELQAAAAAYYDGDGAQLMDDATYDRGVEMLESAARSQGWHEAEEFLGTVQGASGDDVHLRPMLSLDKAMDDEETAVADRVAVIRSESEVARKGPRNWRSIEVATPSEPIIVSDEVLPRSELLAGVIDIESVVGDHSRDPDESASWDDEEWLAHIRRLIAISCETGSAEITPDGDFRLQYGLPRLDEGTVRYVNPDGSPGGVVSTTAFVGDDVWISVQASVLDDAYVVGRARIEDQAIVCHDAIVCDEASVSGRATIIGRAVVMGQARVWGDALVGDDAIIAGHARVADDARVAEHGIVCANALVCDHAYVGGRSRVSGKGQVADWAQLRGRNLVTDNAIVEGRTVLDGWRVVADMTVL